MFTFWLRRRQVASRWLGPLKGFTTYRANELLGSHGQAFWQDESYNHVARSEAPFDRIRAYLEENPGTAGLVAEAWQHPWSSATRRLKGGCGQDWPPHIL